MSNPFSSAFGSSASPLVPSSTGASAGPAPMSTSGGYGSALSAVSSSSQAAPAFLSNPFGASVPVARSSSSVFSASTSADLFLRASTAVPLATSSLSVSFSGFSLGSESSMSSVASGASPTLFASACSLASSSAFLFGASQGPGSHSAPLQSTNAPSNPFASLVPASTFALSSFAFPLSARVLPVEPAPATTLDSLERDLSAADVSNLVSCSVLVRGILAILKPRTTARTKRGKAQYSITRASTNVVDSVVAAGTVAFLCKVLSATASTPELLLNASSCLEAISSSSNAHCDCMIHDGCCREMLSVIKRSHEDQAHSSLISVLLSTLSPIVSRIAAMQSETTEFDVFSVLSVLNQLLSHVDAQVRSRCLELFEPSLRIVLNVLRSADSNISQRLVSSRDFIPCLTKLLKTRANPVAAIFGANVAPFMATPMPSFLRDDSTKRPSGDTLQTIILEIFCLITDGFAITPDNGDLNSALVQLMQDEGFDAILEHVPKLFADARLGSAELFATQLMSKHIAPFIASGASRLTAETLVSTARRHLVSQKLPVIKAYMEARIVVELSKLLSSATPCIVEDSLACLKILVSSSSSLRDAAIAQGLLAPLFGLIAACSADPTCRDIFKLSRNLLTSMIEMYPAIDAAVLQPFFPEISRLVCHADAEVQLEASRVLVAITDAGHVLSVFQQFDTDTVALLLKSPDGRIRAMGTRILLNYVRSADAVVIERLLSCRDCAPLAAKLLKARTSVDCSDLNDPKRVMDILNSVISSGEC